MMGGPNLVCLSRPARDETVLAKSLRHSILVAPGGVPALAVCVRATATPTGAWPVQAFYDEPGAPKTVGAEKRGRQGPVAFRHGPNLRHGVRREVEFLSLVRYHAAGTGPCRRTVLPKSC